ncbi:M20 family peptidase, partial [Pseudomonadota bacterium]|nr:M20 family peptidase [Pseudomonadota bacterium]
TLAVVGIVPGMTIDSVLKDINDHLNFRIGKKNNVGFKVKQVPESLFVSATNPVQEYEEPVKSLVECYELLMDKKPGINRKNAFNDTIRFRGLN